MAIDPEAYLKQVEVEFDPEETEAPDRLSPSNIMDPTLNKAEIKSIILADTYFEDTPTEDEGVYRRHVSLPLKNVILVALFSIALIAALFYLAATLAQ